MSRRSRAIGATHRFVCKRPNGFSPAIPRCRWRPRSDAYTGKYQTLWYRTIKGELIDGELKYVETAVTHMNLKSFIARITKVDNQHNVLGVLNDGTPIKSVEAKVDDGAWQLARLDPATKDKYGWKLFTYI
jgi:hypothetical protein